MNGVYGQSGAPIVLIGQGADAQVEVINGAKKADLALVGIQHIGTINGTGGDIYIYGGEVGTLNGNAQSVHLMNGAKVNLINGNFQNVYLYAGSTVAHSNGNVNISNK